MKTYRMDSDATEAGWAQDMRGPEVSLGEYADETAWSRRARDVLSVKLRYLSPDLKWAGSKALVLQCESGLMADGLVRRGCEVTAGDSRAYMVELARARSRQNGYRVRYRHFDDLAALPFLDGVFDVVLCDHVFERSRERAPILREVVRVLRPGGQLLYSTVTAGFRARIYAGLAPGLMLPGLPRTVMPLHPLRPTKLKRLLRAAGLEPGRQGGLHLKPLSLAGTPQYHVRHARRGIYLGSARRS